MVANGIPKNSKKTKSAIKYENPCSLLVYVVFMLAHAYAST